MDYKEYSGKTVNEALANALVELGCTSDKVEYEVIRKESNGFLGLFNAKTALIKVRKKSDEEISNSAAKNTAVENVSASEVKAESKDENIAAVSAHIEKSLEEENTKEDTEKKAVSVEESKNVSVMSHEEIERRINTFLDDMFKAMDMEVKVDITFDEKEECVNVELSGNNMGVLIGKRGQTLDSIQYLISLVVNKGKDKYVRIKVDTENYRERRKETLESLAKNIAYKVKRSRRSVSLEPMNPYERRIIHSALQNDKFVSTKSEGEEPFRHVVVFLDKEKSGNR